jgi:2-dehydropantoate 2-reductase
MRVLVAGAGGIGSVIGALLRLAGDEVTLLGRPAHLAGVAADGLRLDGLWGEHVATGFHLVEDAAHLSGQYDGILVTVKSYDTCVIAEAVGPFLAPGGIIISLQNGLGNIEQLVATAGRARALGGRVIFGAEAVAPGRVRVTVYADPVLIGPWGADPDPRITAQAQWWAHHCDAAGIPSAATDDIAAALWGKVLYNTPLNPLSALLGVHYGALTENEHARSIMDQVIDETFAVATAEGIVLPWASAAEYRATFYDRLVPSTFHHRSSMLQDLERGRRTEIDAINGEVWKRGAARGIVTPINELLTRLMHAREASRAGKVS